LLTPADNTAVAFEDDDDIAPSIFSMLDPTGILCVFGSSVDLEDEDADTDDNDDDDDDDDDDIDTDTESNVEAMSVSERLYKEKAGNPLWSMPAFASLWSDGKALHKGSDVSEGLEQSKEPEPSANSIDGTTLNESLDRERLLLSDERDIATRILENELLLRSLQYIDCTDDQTEAFTVQPLPMLLGCSHAHQGPQDRVHPQQQHLG
jgi:hypothetical protein